MSAAVGTMCIFAQVSTAVAQTDGPGAASAVDAYNTATDVEREGFENRLGGAGSEYLHRCQRDCLISALASYHSMPSKLAAWRVVSCAAGVENWLLVQLAALSFATLEPAGISGWTHPSFSEAEVARVRAAAEAAPRHVGVVRLAIPAGTEVFWGQPGPPVDLSTSFGLPAYDADLDAGAFRAGPLQVGDMLFMPVGTAFSAVLSRTGEVRRVDVQVRALADGGPQVAEPSASAPSAPPPDSPSPEFPDESASRREIASEPFSATVPIPAATQQRLPPGTTVEQDAGVSALAVLGWTGLSAGVLGAGAGALLWGLADSVRQDLDAACPTRAGCDPALRSDYEQGRDFTLGGNILTIAGGVLGALGIVFLVIDAATPSEPTVTVRASASGIQLQVGGAL